MLTGPDSEFLTEMRALEATCLLSDDPMVQSGFLGGRERWCVERSPLVEAIDRDGSFLDVGCANGLLAADVVEWAAARGHRIVPWGIDLGGELVALAKSRHPDLAENFQQADAWRWEPGRSWTYVYSLVHLAPEHLLCEWIRRLWSWVEPGGRLIVGAYGSRSQGFSPTDVNSVLTGCGFEVAASSSGGEGPITRFVWADKPIEPLGV